MCQNGQPQWEAIYGCVVMISGTGSRMSTVPTRPAKLLEDVHQSECCICLATTVSGIGATYLLNVSGPSSDHTAIQLRLRISRQADLVSQFQ